MSVSVCTRDNVFYKKTTLGAVFTEVNRGEKLFYNAVSSFFLCYNIIPPQAIGLRQMMY